MSLNNLNEHVSGIIDLVTDSTLFKLKASEFTFSNDENIFRFKISGVSHCDYILVKYDTVNDRYCIEYFKNRKVKREIKPIGYMKCDMVRAEDVRKSIVAETLIDLDDDDYFGQPVYTYTRKDLFATGDLIDLSTTFPSETAVCEYPVACTNEIWELIGDINEFGGNVNGYVRSMCYESENSNERKKLSENIFLFPCYLPRKTNRLTDKKYWLKCKIDEIGNGDFVITILFSNQD